MQAALLEAMEERQVTVAGTTHPLPELFLVMATQNPIEQEGTYPLPEAQMDRFLMHVMIGYPDEASEAQIVRLVRGESGGGAKEQAEPSIAQQVIFDGARPRSTASTSPRPSSATSSTWSSPPATRSATASRCRSGCRSAPARAAPWRWIAARAPTPGFTVATT